MQSIHYEWHHNGHIFFFSRYAYVLTGVINGYNRKTYDLPISGRCEVVRPTASFHRSFDYPISLPNPILGGTNRTYTITVKTMDLISLWGNGVIYLPGWNHFCFGKSIHIHL